MYKHPIDLVMPSFHEFSVDEGSMHRRRQSTPKGEMQHHLGSCMKPYFVGQTTTAVAAINPFAVILRPFALILEAPTY